MLPPFFSSFVCHPNAKLAAAKWIKGIDSDDDDVDQCGHAAPDFIVVATAKVIL